MEQVNRRTRYLRKPNLCKQKNPEEATDEEVSVEDENLSDEEMLGEIYHYVINDVWNDEFCVVWNYSVTGKNADGTPIPDIKATLRKLEKTMDKMNEYNSFMATLQDPKYMKETLSQCEIVLC